MNQTKVEGKWATITVKCKFLNSAKGLIKGILPHHKEIVVVVVVNASASSSSSLPSAAPMVPHARVVEEHVSAVPVELVPHLVKSGVGIKVMLLLLLGVSRPSDGAPATAERGRRVGRGEGRRRPLTAALRIHFDELRFNEILLGKSGLFWAHSI